VTVLRVTSIVTVTLFLVCGSAAAQATPACRFICAPQLLVEPTFTIERLARAPRVRTVAGDEVRQGRQAAFELILAADVPTTVPRLGFTGEAILTPFANDNSIELELETNIGVIQSEQTGGWLSSHVDIVDTFSPAERPGDDRAYTHKLNVEWDTALAAFKWLPAGHWLRAVELEGSLDYVATGLPKAGDVIDGERYLTAASPWSLSVVIVVPMTP
jgi:hypothetical protein